MPEPGEGEARIRDPGEVSPEPMDPESPLDFQIFIPITKVDAARHEVWGDGIVEQPDHSGEIFDYASSKPKVESWSQDVAKRSGGKSKGNVREMHQAIAAGKIISLSFDDARKAVPLGVKITNPQTWDQVEEGVLTGFSLGGRYAKRWTDPQTGMTRYTADPSEWSVVDAPCVPDAVFQMVKADGTIEERHFKPRGGDPISKADAVPGTPSAENPSPMQIEEQPIVKYPDKFNTLVLNLNNLPSTGVLIAAGVPGQMKVEAISRGSPATDKSPAPTVQAQPAGVLKGVQSAPGLRDASKDQPMSCGNCKHFRCFDFNHPYCRLYDFATQFGWMCDGWEMASDETTAPLAGTTGMAMSQRGEDMDKNILDSARSLLSTARAQIAESPDLAGQAIDQAMSVLSVAVDHAPLSQDTTGAADAQSAASTQATTVESTGPTTQAAKTGVDTPSTPSAISDESSASSMDPSMAVSTDKTESTPSNLIPSTPTAVPSSVSVTKQETTPQVAKQEGVMPQQNVSIPASTSTPAVFVSGQSVIDTHLPEFMAAMEGGSLRAAQAVVKGLNGGMFEQRIFDEMMQKSMKHLLDEGKWSYKEMENDPRRLYRKQQIGSNDPAVDILQKAIGIGDIPNIYLIRLVRLMIPLYMGLRRRLPATPPPVGADKAQWRAELGATNFDFADAMSVAENTNGQTISESFLTFAAPYKRISVTDAVTLESVYGSRGFDDPLQVAIVRALTLLMGADEHKTLWDNSASISAPGAVTGTGSASGGQLTAGSYTAYVSALTYRGWLKYVQYGLPGANYAGETNATAASAVTGSPSAVDFKWDAVKNAAAYAVYVSDGSNEHIVAVTTVNAYHLSKFPHTGSPHSAVNNSANANGYEGVCGWCDLDVVYGNSIPNKYFASLDGSGLSTYAGGIEEFDELLAYQWTTWKDAPTLILCSANSVKHLTKQILSLSNVTGYRIEVGAERGNIAGGAFVTGYYNKFAPYADGAPRVLDIMGHPDMPDGTFKFLTETVTYPIARESRGLAIEQLIPYTYFPLAQLTPEYPFDMLCSQTVECFHPGAQSSINNVDVTA